PIHPNCRCTTVIADFTSGTRNARDPLTGKNYKVNGDMTFAEWKNSLTDEQKAAMSTHVQQMKNKSADETIFEKYSQIYGSEFPKTLDGFQEMKYYDSERWQTFKDNKQSRLNQMEFENMSGLIGKLGNQETRLWYKYQDESIPEKLDLTQSLEQQARQAYSLRNQNRTNTRALMKDTELRESFDKLFPNKSFDFYYNKYKYDEHNNVIRTDEEVYKEIIHKSTTTNKKADKKAGV
ncbi:MAG: phage head morphogenesis protein, partial [Oscillospiraceae bacterium]|nr:phage head morphogenesis protein [Oscillospiraceae bacterium]